MMHPMHMKKRKMLSSHRSLFPFFILFILLALSTNASASTWHISPNGTDTSSCGLSPSSPCFTPAYVSIYKPVSSGDILSMASGIYNSTFCFSPYQLSGINLIPNITITGSSSSPPSTIIDCQGSGYRGLTFNDTGASGKISISNLTIRNAAAVQRNIDDWDDSGGGIMCRTRSAFFDLSLTNVRFESTNAMTKGGAFYSAGNCSISCSNCLFYNNTAGYSGQAIQIETQNLVYLYDNCVFIYPSSAPAITSSAVVIQATLFSSFTVTNSLFKGFQAYNPTMTLNSYGFVLNAANGYYLEIFNTTFQDCSATQSQFQSIVAFLGITITNVTSSNFLRSSGNSNAVVSVDSMTGPSCSFYLSNVQFINNSVSVNPQFVPYSEGIALFVAACNTYISSSTFTNSTYSFQAALGSVQVNGGHIFYSSLSFGNPPPFSPLLSVQGSSFQLGNAQNGGAIAALGAQVTIIGCSFTQNYASFQGGSLYLSAQISLWIQSSTFDSSTAREAGAIYGNLVTLDSGDQVTDMNMISLTFNDCSALNGDGGAMLLQGEAQIIPYLITCNRCSAVNGNGGCAAFAGNLQVSIWFGPNYFINNTASIDGGCFYISDFVSFASVLVAGMGNSAPNGNGGFLAATGNSLYSLTTQQSSPNNILENNSALNGGTFSMSASAVLQVMQVDIINSVATGYGGVLYVLSSLISIQQSQYYSVAALPAWALVTISGSYANIAGGVAHIALPSALPYIASILESISIANTGSGNYGPVLSTAPSQWQLNWLNPNISSSSSGSSIVSLYPGQSFSLQLSVMDALNQPVSGIPLVFTLSSVSINGNVQLFGPSSSQVLSNQGLVLWTGFSVNGQIGSFANLSVQSGSQSAMSASLPSVISKSIQLVHCPPGFVYSQSTLQCSICPSGLYSLSIDSAACQQCPSNAICTNGNQVTSLEGYWIVQSDAMAYSLPCLTPFCQGNNQCVGKHAGTMCGGCSTGYSSSESVCVRCDKPQPGPLVLAAVVILAFTLLQHSISQSTSGHTKILFLFSQSAFIVNGLYGHSLSLKGMFALNSAPSFGFCLLPLDDIQEFLASIILPLLLWGAFALICSVWLLFARTFPKFSARKCGKFLNSLSDGKAVARTAILLSIFSYQNVTSTSLSYLSCTSIHIDSVVASNPSISCTSDSYSRWRPLFLSLFLVMIVVPFLIMVVLYRHFQSIGEDKASLFSRYTFGILYESYQKPATGKVTRFMVEAAFLLERLILAISSSLAVSYTSEAVRSLIMVCLSFGILSLHSNWRPFATDVENRNLIAASGALVLFAAARGSLAYEQAGIPVWSFSSFIYWITLALLGLTVIARQVSNLLASQTSKPSSSRRQFLRRWFLHIAGLFEIASLEMDAHERCSHELVIQPSRENGDDLYASLIPASRDHQDL